MSGLSDEVTKRLSGKSKEHGAFRESLPYGVRSAVTLLNRENLRVVRAAAAGDMPLMREHLIDLAAYAELVYREFFGKPETSNTSDVLSDEVVDCPFVHTEQHKDGRVISCRCTGRAVSQFWQGPLCLSRNHVQCSTFQRFNKRF
jgi:hypothetical protein